MQDTNRIKKFKNYENQKGTSQQRAGNTRNGTDTRIGTGTGDT